MKMYWFEVRVLSHLPHALVTGLRSFLTQHGLFEPAITQSETRGELQYPSFAPSEWVAVQATGALKELTGNEENRRRIVEVYRHELSRFSELIERGGLGERWEIPEVILAGDAQPLLRFPLFAPSTAESDALIQQLRRRGIWAQAWYRPELFPGVTTPEKYGLDVLERSGVDVSLSRELIARVICLPTELSEQKAHEACEIICAR
jgi:dTDP-4-amino-4,6-dideoxygalactose transaminase